MYLKLYGKCSQNPEPHKTTIIDNPDVIRARQLQQEQQKLEKKPTSLDQTPIKNSTPRGPDKQIERRTVDGRRRITPVFIPDNMAMKHQSFSTSSQEKSKIVIEKLEGVVEPNVTPSKSSNRLVPVNSLLY